MLATYERKQKRRLKENIVKILITEDMEEEAMADGVSG